MTDKDEALIALLKTNARESVSSLARKLGLSRTTVQDRLARLESNGTIAGYTVRLTRDSGLEGVRAFVTIEVEPRRTQDVMFGLSRLPQIEALHSVSGKFDLIALVHTGQVADMDRVLDLIGEIPGVKRTESAVILSTKIDRR